MTLVSISSWYLVILSSSSAFLAVSERILCRSATRTAISFAFLSASILLIISSSALSASSSSIACPRATIRLSSSLSLAILAASALSWLEFTIQLSLFPLRGALVNWSGLPPPPPSSLGTNLCLTSPPPLLALKPQLLHLALSIIEEVAIHIHILGGDQAWRDRSCWLASFHCQPSLFLLKCFLPCLPHHVNLEFSLSFDVVPVMTTPVCPLLLLHRLLPCRSHRR